MRVTITDATGSGRETARMLLDDVPNPVLLRDLIRHRVREEVARFNASPGPHFNGLVQPTDSESTLNGYALRRPRWLDPGGPGGGRPHGVHAQRLLRVRG